MHSRVGLSSNLISKDRRKTEMKNISRIRCSLKRRNRTGNLIKKKKIRLRVKKHLRFSFFILFILCLFVNYQHDTFRALNF